MEASESQILFIVTQSYIKFESIITFYLWVYLLIKKDDILFYSV